MNRNTPLLRWLLLPFTLLFGAAVACKDLLYKSGVFTSVGFAVPVVSIGNLNVGGSGKSPHVEYLIRLLRPYLHVAVMSRGFGRTSTGFRIVHARDESTQSGDEPLMYAKKYPDITISVSESRSVGIPLLLQQRPEVQCVLLDDAFQHRSVKPYLNILLTGYDDPYFEDWLLPSGSLREWRYGAQRADLIIVTKCPATLSPEARSGFLKKIAPLPHQSVFFTKYQYHPPYSMLNAAERLHLTPSLCVLLVCGIAKTEYLTDYVASLVGKLDLLDFGDHHDYTESDLELIAARYTNMHGQPKVILTTEKDAVRLQKFLPLIHQRQLPIYLLPVTVAFLFEDGPVFDLHIRQSLLNFRV